MLRRMLAMSVLFLLPSIAFASVDINEIAWMGTSVSASNEWIELHNNGTSEVALSGWKIVSPTSKIAILLKGTIAPDGFYLIERTDDNSVSGIPADLVSSFSTGLSNGGMTLQLVDAGGVTIDEVVGGVNWKNIGGDAITFATAQRTPTGWTTGTPTPRAANVSGATADTSGTHDDTDPSIESAATDTPATVQDITTTETSSGGGSSSTPVPKAVVTRESYRVTIHSSDRIYKDIPTSLRATVTGLHDEPLPDATLSWNLGDGTTATGKEVSHVYHFPGIYPVVVTASYNGLTTKVRARAQVIAQDVHITTALPGTDGYISIVSPVDIDLSGWSLRDGGTSFVFPPQTQLFGKVPATFPNAITGMYVQQTLALFRSDGHLMSAVENLSDADVAAVEYPAETLSLARSATQPPVLRNAPTTTATSLSAWAMASAAGSTKFPNWGYWVLAAFFVAATGLIIVLSSAFNPKREVDAEVEKYTYIELDSNLEDIT